MTLREVLHAHIPTLFADSTLRDAVDKMDLYQFPGLVIVDDEQRPLGVVTEGDVCRAAIARGNVTSLSSEPALEHASKDPTVAGPDTEIGDAFHTMISKGLTLLPVVDDQRLIGLVLRVDLMHAMLLDARPDEVGISGND